MRLFRDLRLIPVVALAAAALFLLKVSAIVIEGGYTLIASRVALAQGLGAGAKDYEMPPPAPLEDTAPAPRDDRARSWVRDIYAPEYTGSVTPPKPEPAPAPSAPPSADSGAPATPDTAKPAFSPGERAVLESLSQRRQELETRAREMDVRESLLKAAEKRIEVRLGELKELETRLTGIANKKDEAEAARFKSLVSMYENMKAKDAAKVFDRLNMRVLIELVNAINPRRMSDILGQMSPEVVERLTLEIANRSGAVDKMAVPAELPKIEGRPNKS